MHVCKDESYAASFVKSAQRTNDEVKKETPITPPLENVLKEEIYRAMLYKTGGVDTGLCFSCCKKEFKTGGPQGAVTFQKTLFWSAFTLMIAQVASSVYMSVNDATFYASLPAESNTYLASEFEAHIT